MNQNWSNSFYEHKQQRLLNEVDVDGKDDGSTYDYEWNEMSLLWTCYIFLYFSFS